MKNAAVNSFFMRRIESVRQYRLKALGKAEPKSATSFCNLFLITGRPRPNAVGACEGSRSILPKPRMREPNGTESDMLLSLNKFINGYRYDSHEFNFVRCTRLAGEPSD